MFLEKDTLKIRVLWSILLFLSIFFTPWFVYSAMIILGIIFFNFYWEGLFFSIFLDFIFSIKLEIFYNFTFIHTLFFLVFFYLIQILKKNLIQ